MTTLNLKSGRAAVATYDTAETLSEIRTHAAEKRKVSQRFLYVQLFGPALGFSRYLLLSLSKMCQVNENCAYQLNLHVSDFFFFLMISKFLALCVTIFPNLVLFRLDSATSLHRMLESRIKKRTTKNAKLVKRTTNCPQPSLKALFILTFTLQFWELVSQAVPLRSSLEQETRGLNFGLVKSDTRLLRHFFDRRRVAQAQQHEDGPC